ncbi:hypothetical protein JTB14_018453 [Gonioctena quinquepunctata]|nr:hypothetical protein JTB14_018453 [Gonioctena quinquepunctata]
MDMISHQNKSHEDVEKADINNIYNEMNRLDCDIRRTLKDVSTTSLNLLNEIELIAHENKTENSLPIERESASTLISLKVDSCRLLTHFSEHSIPELDKEVNFASVYKYAEDLEKYNDDSKEFNRYLKMISMGIKKISSNTRNTSNDDSSLSGTFLSVDFNVGNPVASSPISSSKQ